MKLLFVLLVCSIPGSLNARKIERFKGGNGCGTIFPIKLQVDRPTGETVEPCTSLNYYENQPDQEEVVRKKFDGGFRRDSCQVLLFLIVGF